MSRRLARAAAAAAAVTMLGACGLVSLIAASIGVTGGSAQAACVPGGAALPPDATTAAPAGAHDRPAGRTGPVGKWDQTQVGHAATVVAVGRRLNVPARGWVIAVATAMTESSLRNVDYGDAAGPDSRGLFQQRKWWGSLAERMDPATAATLFYSGGRGGQPGLLDINGWQRMRLTEAAQAVQRSGRPEAYQKFEADAQQVTAHVLGLPSLDELGAGDPSAPCGLATDADVTVPPGGWIPPVQAPVGSGFRTSARPGHDGVDLMAPLGARIRAPSTGRVIAVVCNSSSGTCDRPGSTEIKGCGWYVDLLHAGNIVTRMCHMKRRPEVSIGQTVKAGQPIGLVGSSGNSSGPHLHFEVHIGQPAVPTNAIDPVAFMRRVGGALGRPPG